MTDAFLKYLQFEKRASPHTVTSYSIDLGQFAQFLEENFKTTPEAADDRMVRTWLVTLVDAGNNPRSVNRKVACLRSFFKFLKQNGYINVNPTWRVRALKTQQNLPQFVKQNEVDKVLAASPDDDAFTAIRDHLIMELLYGTGIRLSELIGLRDNDVDLNAQTIRVLGKRNKERIIPFSTGLVKVIAAYRQEKKRSVGESKSDKLLVTEKGTDCYPVLMNRIVKKRLEGVNIDKRSPHVLRHTYATHLLNNGAELNAVKDLLGHTSLAATQVYTHNSIDKLKRVFKKYHPKA